MSLYVERNSDAHISPSSFKTSHVTKKLEITIADYLDIVKLKLVLVVHLTGT
jgi:nucleoid-associated protein YejK